MPSIFRTSSGKEYEYHEKFDGPEGDLVIISSDDKALRCEKAVLLVNSSVFRFMFSTCDSDGSEVHLDHPASALATVLQALNHRLDVAPTKWQELLDALDICSPYDMAFLGARILRKITDTEQYDQGHAYELFCLAAKFDDTITACRIIAERGDEDSGPFCQPESGPRKVMENLPGVWTWAYMQAH
ncbi:hypothetical protein I317_05629 [Kwoniella heveanensis CBS 569]|nr:hypothetical protein I317_05629 [Kwoniella heveanensis CBS 569]